MDVDESTLETPQLDLTADMRFTSTNVMAIVIYSILFVISAIGNLMVFITLAINKNSRSRVKLFILHLSFADLIVTFVMIPTEIALHFTVSWAAGDISCRILKFWQAFGFYLSSFVLVVISLDRYFAVKYPMSIIDGNRRGKLMLTLAWILSLLSSAPQSVIFHLEHHPQFQWFGACVDFNFFPSPQQRLVYNLFILVAIYAAPLCIITTAYTRISLEIHSRSLRSREEARQHSIRHGEINYRSSTNMRRSGLGCIERARAKTFKLSLIIVTAFIVCWTPYFVMATWCWFDFESADQINPKLLKGLFMFAVSNSCVNPIIYGVFVINFKHELEQCCCCMKALATSIPIYNNQVSQGTSSLSTEVRQSSASDSLDEMDLQCHSYT